ILHEHNYIGDFKYIEDGKGGKFRVKLIGRINKCGSIRPRFSVSVDDLIRWEKKYLPASGIGILIVTTSKGIMDQNQVRKERTGGKLLGYVY
ncbi:MAG: 30S ribosomal protein S8, partial [Candidatus Aenigmatarchaeota archaeon]